eukprot:TRINITY_DN12140_c0_g1_i1.p1 TRINITY_DN12140_c0_g1~~TRINITY_DN12140_c0_g1_i1.p1  ORF type:complete len:163 (-),score=32.61 TRINITY_DN12140_c0_g1_i1:107-595(-)
MQPNQFQKSWTPKNQKIVSNRLFQKPMDLQFKQFNKKSIIQLLIKQKKHQQYTNFMNQSIWHQILKIFMVKKSYYQMLLTLQFKMEQLNISLVQQKPIISDILDIIDYKHQYNSAKINKKQTPSEMDEEEDDDHDDDEEDNDDIYYEELSSMEKKSYYDEVD